MILGGCHRHHEVTRGCYFWKTTFKPTIFEINKLKSLQCRRIYIRLFDVDWDEKTNRNVPVAPLNISHPDTAIEYVPVIFITQQTLQKLKPDAVPGLADNINDLAKILCSRVGLQPREVQVDCDWTAANKEVYFSLLKLLKSRSFFTGRILSCTIRLYQAKYTLRSGVPPVDKGLLMCYNMGDLKKYGNKNSILEVAEAKEYLKYIDRYPLPLDIALPLFSWCVLFRNQQFTGILRDVSPENVAGSNAFSRDNENLFRSLRDTLWHGYQLRKGDQVRTEVTRYGDVKELADFTARKVANNKMNVIFFHCDSLILSKFSTDELEAIFDSYR